MGKEGGTDGGQIPNKPENPELVQGKEQLPWSEDAEHRVSPHAGKIPPFQHLRPHPSAKTLHALPEPPARPARFLEQPFFLPKIRILIIFLGSSAVRDLFSLADRYGSVSSGIHCRSGTKKVGISPGYGFFPHLFWDRSLSRCINYTKVH